MDFDEGMPSRTLTVISHHDNGESYRVTLSPNSVKMVKVPEKMVQVCGMTLYKAYVTLDDDCSAELNINSADLETLEKAVGMFYVD